MLSGESVEDGGNGIPDGFWTVKAERLKGVTRLIAKTERAKRKVPGIREMLGERGYGRTSELKQSIESYLLPLG